MTSPKWRPWRVPSTGLYASCAQKISLTEQRPSDLFLDKMTDHKKKKTRLTHRGVLSGRLTSLPPLRNYDADPHRVPSNCEIDELQTDLGSPNPLVSDAAHAVMDAFVQYSPTQFTRFSEFHGDSRQFDERDARVAQAYARYDDVRRRALVLPAIDLGALLVFKDDRHEGRLVEYVAVAWFELLRVIRNDPREVHRISPRKWEEIIAGAYELAGFDEVVLTPRSGDGGRDVVATKRGVGSIRIFDEVKAYAPGRVVTAKEVRALLGVITGRQNVSKGVLTTTSTFAPRLMEDQSIAGHVPFRLELKPRDVLLPWLDDVANRRLRSPDRFRDDEKSHPTRHCS